VGPWKQAQACSGVRSTNAALPSSVWHFSAWYAASEDLNCSPCTRTSQGKKLLKGNAFASLCFDGPKNATYVDVDVDVDVDVLVMDSVIVTALKYFKKSRAGQT
jgi:hypothetical protein